jgi:hypothetical protein
MGSVSATTGLDNAGPSGLQSIATQDGRPQFASQILWVPWYDNSNLPEFTMIPGECIPPLLARSEYPVSELNEIKSWCCDVADAAGDYRIASIICEDFKQALSIWSFIARPVSRRPWND